MDEGLFRRSVQEVLAHLYQPAYLRAHPLASTLLDAGLIRVTDDLPALMLSTIEQLCPPATAPRSSTGWRQYCYLHLRYIECTTHRRASEDLQISTRQACREHDTGLRAVTGLLWIKYLSVSNDDATVRIAEKPIVEKNLDAGVKSAYDEAAEAELVRVGSEPPDGPTNLAEVLSGALTTVARALAARGLTVLSEIAPELPPVSVNRLALRHILLNLLGFLADRVQAESLAIRAEVGQDTVTLSFVPSTTRAPHLASRSFDEEHPGLSVARRLVEMQAGKLHIQASNGVPDWAIIELPATQAMTVLLVDDSADIGRLFRRYLADTGYCLVQARSAEKARRMIRGVRPGAVLLDVLLPKDDGWQFLEDIRAHEMTARVPVIVCSVVPEESLAAALGVEFLPKPVSRQALLAALARLCPTTQSSQADQAAHQDWLAHTQPIPQS